LQKNQTRSISHLSNSSSLQVSVKASSEGRQGHVVSRPVRAAGEGGQGHAVGLPVRAAGEGRQGHAVGLPVRAAGEGGQGHAVGRPVRAAGRGREEGGRMGRPGRRLWSLSRAPASERGRFPSACDERHLVLSSSSFILQHTHASRLTV
jgi:hypothetical protein